MKEDDLRELKELQKEVQLLNERVCKLSEKIINENKDSDFISIEKEQFSKEILKPIPLITNLNSFTPLQVIKDKKLENSKLETNIGKNVMSIFASILIFIGIFSLAVLIYKDISESFKFILMYGVSISFIGIGFWRVKQTNNTFSKALLGCGVGSIFISILLTHFYFNYISVMTVFVLMVLWSFIIFIWSNKLNSYLLLVLSSIGFSFSIILGSVSDYANDLFIYGILIILHIIFYSLVIKRVQKIRKEDILFFSFSLITSFLLCLFSIIKLKQAFFNFSSLQEIFYILSLIILIGFNFLIIKEKIVKMNKKISTTVLLVFVIILNSMFISSVGLNMTRTSGFSLTPLFDSVIATSEYQEIDNSIENRYNDLNLYDYDIDVSPSVMTETYDFVPLFLLFSVLLHMFFIEKVKYKEKYSIERKTLLTILSLLCGFIIVCSNYFSVIVNLTGLLLIGFLFMFLYQKMKDVLYLYLSIILTFIGLYAGSVFHSLAFCYGFIQFVYLFTILHIVYMLFIFNIIKKLNSRVLNIIFYLFSIVGITLLVNVIGEYFGGLIGGLYTLNKFNVLESNIVDYNQLNVQMGMYFNAIFIFFICSGYALTVKFLKIMRSDVENLNRVIVFILTALGVFLIYNIDFCEVLRFFIIVVASILCFINLYSLLLKRNKWIDLYIGIKVSLFIMCVLNAYLYSFDASYVYSVVGILLAIIAIIIGFKFNTKSLRMYGLSLSILSTLKLVLIDIAYTNSVGRILSFIISGILCFGIVWIYTKMSKIIDINNIDN